MKITEYAKVDELSDTNVFLVDGDDGTKIITRKNLPYALFDNIPEMHNQIYRGKNLGTAITDEQFEQITNGTFHDLWIGDYWLMGQNRFRIAKFEGYNADVTAGLDSPSPTSGDRHMLMVVPDMAFGPVQFYSQRDLSKVGYFGSTLRSYLENDVYNSISSLFGDKLGDTYVWMCNGASLATSFTTSYMGASFVKTSIFAGEASQYISSPQAHPRTVENTMLAPTPLFQLAPGALVSRTWANPDNPDINKHKPVPIWTRTIHSAHVVYVIGIRTSDGTYPDTTDAYQVYTRPFIVIGGKLT